MNIQSLGLLGCFLVSASMVNADCYYVDFGPLSSSASWKYISTTKEEGWNNVAVATDQTQSGDISFSSNYYGKNKEITRQSSSVKNVPIYSSDGEESVLYLTGIKNTTDGTLSMLGGSGSAYASSTIYERFDPHVDLTVMPSAAYKDFITMTGGGSFTLTFSGLASGKYDVLLAAGRSYASGGSATAVSYTLNDHTRILTGDDGSGGGQYAGIINWQGISVGEDGTLTFTVSGVYNEETQKWTSSAINGLIITQVPESSVVITGMLGFVGMSWRRRRK